ncbi:rRNA primary transcript metabolism protein [Mactra antiquata]
MATPMSVHSNFYAQIKGKSLKLEERLQLLRYCWKSSDLYFPNKEQVLLDVLTGMLINKKHENLTGSNICAVWKCLHEILCTKKASEPGRILLKQSAVQLLTDTVRDIDSSCDFIQDLIGCLICVIKSDWLSTVFTAKLDIMVSILSGLCTVQSMTMYQQDFTFSSLVNTVVDRFCTALETASEQNQILTKMCGSFLPKFIPLWSSEPSSNVRMLSAAFLTSVSHRDHHLNFDAYLKSSQGNVGNKMFKRAKSVELMFSTLSSLLKLHPVECCQYLPIIYDKYIQQNCHNGIHIVSHYMFAEICSLIGIQKDSNNTSNTVDDFNVFMVVKQLLDIIKSRELYDVEMDGKNQHIQIQFYRHIVTVLLNCRQMHDGKMLSRSYRDWYACFTTLLEINHHITEPQLTEIFIAGWIDTEVQDEDVNALDKMLDEFVVIYSKLRQIPKLITKLLGSFCLCKADRGLRTPPLFLKRYGEIVQSLPQGMMIDIWKKFAATLKTHFIMAGESGNFQGVCVLFHHYIYNVKVADYSVTEITLQTVWELITLMETDIFVPLLNKYMEEKSMDTERLTYVLYLCEAWGEVVLMLNFYSKCKINFVEKSTAQHSWDLSFIHSYLDTKQWQIMYKLIKKKGNAQLKFVWDVLVVQKLKSVLLFKPKTDWLTQTNCTEAIMEFLSDKNVNQSTTWSGNINAITSENVVIGRWQLLTRSMSSICSILSNEQLRTIADFTINSISMENSGSGYSISSISSEFLSSDVVRENSKLLSNTISAVWSKCSKYFTTRKSASPKKRKTGDLLTSVNTLMSLLSDTHDVDTQSDINKEMCSVLSSILVMKDSVQIEENKDLLLCVKLLQLLPLDKIHAVDQIICITGLLTLKCITDQSITKKKDVIWNEISTLCIKLCTILIETCRESSPFEIISVNIYMSWLQSMMNSSIKGSNDYYKCTVLAEISCQVIVQDFKYVNDLQTFLNKLIQGDCLHTNIGALNLMLYIMQEVVNLLKRSYLNETLKKGYKDCFVTLATSVMKQIPVLTTSDCSDTASILVRIYTNITSVLSVDDNIKEEFLHHFGDVLRWCENVISEETKHDVYTIMSALMFLESVYKHCSLIPDLVDNDTKWKTWSLLVVFLNQTLSNTSDDPVGTKSTDSATGCLATRDHVSKMKDSKKKVEKAKRSVEKCDVYEDWVESQMKHSEKVRTILEGGYDCSNQDNESGKNSELSSTIEGNESSSVSEYSLNHGNINTVFKTWIFEDKLEEKCSILIRMQLQNVMATLLVSFDAELFQKVLQGLIKDVHPDSLLKNRLRIQSSLFIWRYLLDMKPTDDKMKTFKQAAKDMTLNMQGILHTIQHRHGYMYDIGIPILNIQKQMLSKGEKFLTSKSSILCLHSCIYTPLQGSHYIPAFHAVYNILNTLLVHHKDTVFLNIPAYTECCKTLLLSVVEQSDQDVISDKPEIINNLMSCAYQMEKLFSLIATHRVEFGKVAVYIIPDYLSAVQKLTMLPAIKRAILPAVYKMLDICDKHAITQLHVVLNHGVTEVFKLLYSKYNKFHKYHGRI